MRLIAYEVGRTSLLFPLEEISPLIPNDGREVAEAIVARYNFRGFPPINASREELSKNGAKFENGLFTLNKKPVSIAEFTAYNDGIVVSASTTEIASAFIDDLLEFLRRDYGFREFISKTQRTFISQVVVEFERPLSGLLPTFNRLMSLIGAQTEQTYGIPAKMDFARIDFGLDTVTNHVRYLTPRFLMERRPGIPFEQERYFCSAPMHTRSHLAILEEIEGMAAAK